MASKQFIELLQQLHETGEKKPLRWEPIRRKYESHRCDFCLALGGGVIHLVGNDSDDMHWSANVKAYLMTRDGLLVDEYEAKQNETLLFETMFSLFTQARDAAFNLPRMIEDIRNDLAAGKTRELPEKLVRPDENDIPF